MPSPEAIMNRERIPLAVIRIRKEFDISEEMAHNVDAARRYCAMRRQTLPGAIEVDVAPGDDPYAYLITVYENPNDSPDT